jgi:hypothetical protein
MAETRKLAAILAADVVGFSRRERVRESEQCHVSKKN